MAEIHPGRCKLFVDELIEFVSWNHVDSDGNIDGFDEIDCNVNPNKDESLVKSISDKPVVIIR